MTLDETDLRILDLLQDDCTLTHETIGHAVGLSASAARRRISALRASGAITREVALLGDDVLPAGITIVVSVAFERETAEAYDAFRAAMRADVRVQQCYATAGQFDFVLVVSAPSPPDHEAWGERLLVAHPGLRRVESYVVWSTVKFETKRQLGRSAD